MAGSVVPYDDRTGGCWSQIIGRTIYGPPAGESFEIVPSTVTRWEA